MNLPANLDVADIAARASAELGRRSFADFVRLAWPLAGTTEPLVWGWHLDALCLHLQAVAEGQIRRLLVNIPPAHGKSKIVSVLFPAWLWARRPETQILCASYAASLAERDSVFCRELVESEWYKRAYMHGWTLKADQNAKSYWANTKQGHRVSIGVGGTGQRCDGAIIDDPLDIEKALSEAHRAEANHWIGHTLPTRFNDAERGWTVMIMQRLHEDDPSAFVLSGGDWTHLRMESEYDVSAPCVTHARDGRELWRDPRTEDGETLFPAKFPASVLADLKLPNKLGEEGFAAQHQQRPMPKGGGMFKVADWRFHKPDGKAPDHRVSRPRGCYEGPANPLPKKWDRQVISVDGTFKKTERGSFVAIHVWGASGARRCLLDRVHARMDYDACEKALLGIITRWPLAREKIVEDKANGSALVSRLRDVLHVTGVIAEPTGADSKQQRASVNSLPYQRAGNVELPDGAPWLGEYIGEHGSFPLGRTDDDVDCQSQALKHLESLAPTFAYSQGAFSESEPDEDDAPAWRN